MSGVVLSMWMLPLVIGIGVPRACVGGRKQAMSMAKTTVGRPRADRTFVPLICINPPDNWEGKPIVRLTSVVRQQKLFETRAFFIRCWWSGRFERAMPGVAECGLRVHLTRRRASPR